MDAASIVIAGYGFALPGACTPRELVSVLTEGRICYGNFPAERIDPDIYLDPDARPGDARLSTRRGGVVREHGTNGAGVTRAWLLDVLDHALASARLSKAATAGHAAPVFLAHSRGGGPGLYDAAMLAAAGDLLPSLSAAAHPNEFDPADVKAIVADARAGLAGSLHPGQPGERALHHLPATLARVMGTTGKAVVVDGNCTGGLVALDLAAFEVAHGAPFAIAGALSYVDAVNQVLYSNARLLSKDGCLPFTDDNGGTVISDGVVLLVVTTLDFARRNDWAVHGIVRGIGGANDGAIERYMLSPNPRGHALAMARAHDRAGLDPKSIDVYLTHGSGTRVGDAIEADVFDTHIRTRGGASHPIPILSIKGHIGHAKEAAGLANLVTALALFEAGSLFDPVHPGGARSSFDRFDAIRVGPETAIASTTARVVPRRAGISAIASGGQNYHVLVEAPPTSFPAWAPAGSGKPDVGPIAIVGLAACFADAPNVESLRDRLRNGHRPFRHRAPSPGWRAFAEDAGALRAWCDEHPDLYTDLGARLRIEPTVWARRAAAMGERPADIARHDPLHYLMIDLARDATRGHRIPPGSNVAVVLAADHCSDFGLRQVVAARLPEIERHLGAALNALGRDARETHRTLRTAIQHFRSDLPDLSASSLFNISPSFIAARIARAFDLTGPTCAVEAGGGASFVAAIEVAGKRLADGEVDAVLCASADMRSGISRSAEECALGQLSRSGECSAFATTSDGYLPGEGGSVFLLRRLADAEQRGDPILGVIQSIGSGLAPDMSPRQLVSPAALEQAIRSARRKAGISADDIAFVEGFGCGVPSSDRAEIAAVASGYCERSAAMPLGSIIPDIGHCGASAAAASIIKSLLALRDGELPPTRCPDAISSSVAGGVSIAASPLPLPAGARYAGINAASPGGTHYHVIVEGGRPG